MKRKLVLENGKVLKTVPTNIRTHVFKNVLVATTRIGQFSEVNSSNTKVQKMEVGVNLDNIIEKYNQNKPLIAVKPILQDNLVLKTSVKKKPDVVKDMAVKIQFSQNSNFDIEIDGIAKTEGNIGDIITVKNATYTVGDDVRVTDENGSFTLKNTEVAIFVSKSNDNVSEDGNTVLEDGKYYLITKNKYYVKENSSKNAEISSCKLNNKNC